MPVFRSGFCHVGAVLFVKVSVFMGIKLGEMMIYVMF